MSELDLRFEINRLRDYAVQLLFQMGYSCRANLYPHREVKSCDVRFNWFFGHGGSLNFQSFAYADGEELISGDEYRVIGMNESYSHAETMELASAVENFLTSLLPKSKWESRYGTCQSSFHDHVHHYSGNGYILKDWAGRLLCLDCSEVLSLPEGIYHRSGETKGERSERDKMTQKVRWKILERDMFTCQSCGRSAPDVKLHVDHKIPIAMGGKTEESNLHTLCAECNLGKHAKIPQQSTLDFWERVR